MLAVRILRLLRRRVLLVALAALAAVLAGLASTYDVSPFPPKLASTEISSGLASGRVLVSARKESASGLQAKVAATLAERATLVAELMATDSSQARIARDAGIEPDQLAILGPSAGAPMLSVPLAERATEAAGSPRVPYVLTAGTDGQVSIITLRAAAPSSRVAARLVEAAADSLDELISSRSSRTPALLVERLGPAAERTVVVTPSRATGVAVALVVFTLACTAIVLVEFLRPRRFSGSRRVVSRTVRSS